MEFLRTRNIENDLQLVQKHSAMTFHLFLPYYEPTKAGGLELLSMSLTPCAHTRCVLVRLS